MINSATTVFSVVVEDALYDLNFTLQDGAGVVVDLTGAALVFAAQLVSDYPVEFTGNMSVVSASGGTCKYTVAATDFPVAGVYNAQIQATYSGSGKIITWPNIQITALSRVPQ